MRYLIDANVLITAKNSYYAFSICPGFWDSILRSHSVEDVHSIDRVEMEICRGRPDEDLVEWVCHSVPEGFFLRSDTPEVVTAYQQVMQWVNNHQQYRPAAKTEFAAVADGWLVAHGIATGLVVVTNEQPRPDSRRKIQLPDVCNAFGVHYEDTFSMLRNLNAQYHFSSPA